MPQTPHVEKHFTAGNLVRDVVIGMSDGLTREQARPIVDALESKPQAWVDFMMQFELGLDKPEPTRARNSALTIAT